MIINSSNVAMTSTRRFSSASVSVNRISTEGLFPSNPLSDKDDIVSNKNRQKSAIYGFRDKNGKFDDELMEHYKVNSKKISDIRPNHSFREQLSNMNKIRLQTLNYLLGILSGHGVNSFPITDFSNQNQGFINSDMNYSAYTSYIEEEATTFKSNGIVKTSDGREINFDIELNMSRSFMQTSSISNQAGEKYFMDPLVINMDCPAADVTDQKFLFDLDCDGKKEAISMLGAGSGFLALDKNNNGQIDDGSELFGAKSGNGFEDLRKYDKDGNGWIDEADDIFNDLMIWSMDKSGNSHLVGLGEAGVGAIYLGYSESEFSLNNANNEANARIRSTGFFLYEKGTMGTMQQVDMATEYAG